MTWIQFVMEKDPLEFWWDSQPLSYYYAYYHFWLRVWVKRMIICLSDVYISMDTNWRKKSKLNNLWAIVKGIFSFSFSTTFFYYFPKIDYSKSVFCSQKFLYIASTQIYPLYSYLARFYISINFFVIIITSCRGYLVVAYMVTTGEYAAVWDICHLSPGA